MRPQKIIGSKSNTKRGGPRPGAGRTPDYLQKCKLLAIQLAYLCSESTARRELTDSGGKIKGLVPREHSEVLDDWENMSAFDRGFVYGYLSTRVGINRKEGWGRRL
jgi:hypothetical protein